MSPLSLPNFSSIGVRIRVLWQILQSVREEEEKNEEKKPNFVRSYLGNGLAIYFKFGMWTPLPSRHFCSNFGFNWIGEHGATKV